MSIICENLVGGLGSRERLDETIRKEFMQDRTQPRNPCILGRLTLCDNLTSILLSAMPHAKA